MMAFLLTIVVDGFQYAILQLLRRERSRIGIRHDLVNEAEGKATKADSPSQLTEIYQDAHRRREERT